MRSAHGAQELKKELRSRAMELAFAQAGIARSPEPTPQEDVSKKHEDGSKAGQPKGRATVASKHAKSVPLPRRKRIRTEEEERRARLASEQKRKAKERAKRQAAAHRRATALEAARLEKQRLAEERLAFIQRFISGVEVASFAMLIMCWRKHVVLIDYIRRTGKNGDRLESYERLVRCVEAEWRRRSKLSRSTQEYFDWPSTDIVIGNSPIGDVSWISEGPLGYLGYHVGAKSSLSAAQRQAILRRAFVMHLPPIESPDYMAEWGGPMSGARLSKIANSIASFTRQAKHKMSCDMAEAISSWESDLKMLHDEYYVSMFAFVWPLT